MNQVILIGNLGRDPEVKYLASGEAVATLSLATSAKWKDKAGNQHEKTQWHRVIFWGRQAEVCSEFLNKGNKVAVQGELEYRSYEKDGKEQWITEVHGLRMEMMEPKKQGEARQGEAPAPTARPRPSD